MQIFLTPSTPGKLSYPTVRCLYGHVAEMELGHLYWGNNSTCLIYWSPAQNFWPEEPPFSTLPAVVERGPTTWQHYPEQHSLCQCQGTFCFTTCMLCWSYLVSHAVSHSTLWSLMPHSNLCLTYFEVPFSSLLAGLHCYIGSQSGACTNVTSETKSRAKPHQLHKVWWSVQQNFLMSNLGYRSRGDCCPIWLENQNSLNCQQKTLEYPVPSTTESSICYTVEMYLTS